MFRETKDLLTLSDVNGFNGSFKEMTWCILYIFRKTLVSFVRSFDSLEWNLVCLIEGKLIENHC